MRELCRSILERLGYRVCAAGDGAKALHLVRESKFEPDLVVTDVIMPEMSGPEMARQLQADRPGLPVIYISGYTADMPTPHDALDPGTPFPAKPFSEPELARKVRATLATGVVAAGEVQPRRAAAAGDRGGGERVGSDSRVCGSPSVLLGRAVPVPIELQSLVESVHLMRSPKNAERLLSALERALKGGGEVSSVVR